MGWKTWRRPTLPRLEPQYHGRWGFSRPSSGWDRVRTPRHGHQVVQPIPTLSGDVRLTRRIGGRVLVRFVLRRGLRMISVHGVLVDWAGGLRPFPLVPLTFGLSSRSGD